MVQILPFYFSPCDLGWFVGFCFTSFCRKQAQVLVSSYRIESMEEQHMLPASCLSDKGRESYVCYRGKWKWARKAA